MVCAQNDPHSTPDEVPPPGDSDAHSSQRHEPTEILRDREPGHDVERAGKGPTENVVNDGHEKLDTAPLGENPDSRDAGSAFILHRYGRNFSFESIL